MAPLDRPPPPLAAATTRRLLCAASPSIVAAAHGSQCILPPFALQLEIIVWYVHLLWRTPAAERCGDVCAGPGGAVRAAGAGAGAESQPGAAAGLRAGCAALPAAAGRRGGGGGGAGPCGRSLLRPRLPAAHHQLRARHPDAAQQVGAPASIAQLPVAVAADLPYAGVPPKIFNSAVRLRNSA